MNNKSAPHANIPSSFFLIAFSLALFFFFWGLGSYPLLNNNEGLYAEIAREMQSAYTLKDFVIPHLNGVPYIEKPPLLYWLTSISFDFFGQSEFAARFFPALTGLTTSCAVYYFLMRLKREDIALPAFLVMISSLGYIIFSRMVYFEGLVTCFFSLSLLFFYLWYHEDRVSFLRLAYMCVGLSSLSKGLIGPILLFLTVGTFFIWERTPAKKFEAFFDIPGILIFLGFFLPWPLIAAQHDPNFLWFYFVNEHILRFLNLREPHDYYNGPFYYYLFRIFLYIFPWSAFAFLFCAKSKHKLILSSFHKFLLCWFLVPLVFFSLSRAKANYYMIISIVPMVLLLVLKAQSLFEEGRLTLPLIAVSFSWASVGLLLLSPLYFNVPFSFQPITTLFFFIALCVWGISVLNNATPSPLFLWGGGVFSSMIALLLSLEVAKNLTLNPNISARDLITLIREHGGRDVALYKHFEELSALPFYLKKPVMMIDSVSADLDYGSKTLDASKYFLTSEADLPPTTFLIVPNKALESFKQTPLYLKLDKVFEVKEIRVFRKLPPTPVLAQEKPSHKDSE